jgi:putative Ca2+/H+ antiporter (TMEM165/GDT1 family)
MEWSEPLAVAFATVLVAELADKTQLICISQACRHSYAPVLAGSALALVAITAVGVVGGTVLMLVLPGWVLSMVAGGMFIAFGAYILAKRWRSGGGGGDDHDRAVDADKAVGNGAPSDWKVFATTFGLVAVAEFGDKTQLAVIALTGEFGSPLPVFLGASAAFVLATSAGVLGGRFLSRYVESGALELVAAVLFLVLGAVFLASAALGM